jgi:hypothetical protein
MPDNLKSLSINSEIQNDVAVGPINGVSMVDISELE